MSYIRALSNPESMYVYGTGLNGRGVVWISANTCVDKDGRHIELMMPASTFDGIFRRWKKTIDDTTYRGATLEEIQPIEQSLKATLKHGVRPANAYQWRLMYKDWGKHAIVAYQVTWFYVASRH